MNAGWRKFADWAKKRPMALRLADRLGRGHGRFRYFDHIGAHPAPTITPDLSDWASRLLSAVWIGHATVLLRIGGMTILTDPVFSNRIGVGLGLITGGPKRLARPAVPLRRLPPIDLILVSHAHFDHLDRPTLRRMNKRTPVITAADTGDLIHDLGFKSITELRWGESHRAGEVSVSAREVTHWGARTFFDKHRGYNAYLLTIGNHRVLFGGDTAFQTHFDDLRRLDLAILGIGAYDPYIQAHANPEQAWTMAQRAGAEHVLPIHHSTFTLSYEPVEEPMARLTEAAGKNADRIVASSVGAAWTPG